MRDNHGYSDERALIVAGQRGNLQAGEQIVRQYQSDLLRTAFLLTDSASGARELTQFALEQAFADLRKLDPDRDFRPWLLNRLAVQFLYGPPVSRQDGPLPLSGFVPGGSAQHFNVDNDRSRFRDALMRMDDRDRLLLIFHEFNGLPLDILSRPIDEDIGDLEQRLEQARQRIRQAASIPDERSLPVALNEAAIDAPRVDLWPELADPIEELNDRERFRFRLLTGGAVGVVGIVLLAALVLLLNGALGGSDPGGESSAGEESLAPVATEPPATPTIALTATPVIPDGDVSNQLLTIPMRSSLAGKPIKFLDPEPVGTGLNRPTIDGRVVGMSHDGNQVYILTQLSESGSASLRVLAAIDTQTLEQVWATSLGPASPLSSDDFTIDIVTTGSAVYAALNDNLNRTIAPVFADTDGKSNPPRISARGRLMPTSSIPPVTGPASWCFSSNHCGRPAQSKRSCCGCQT